MLRITFSRDARNSLRRMGRRDAERILDALEKLAAEPEGARREQAGTPTRPPLDVRPLGGREAYRLRVGNWRVIFDRTDFGQAGRQPRQRLQTLGQGGPMVNMEGQW